ncbi:MAG: phosphoribosyl-AMP cyclohydrolase, partial [Nitrospira sp.]|nr:phosphoribosyl-AMP cyclohydrolase [Nitrospira sp.]
MSDELSQRIKFDEQGLLPAIVQDWADGSVLMLGYMNQEAVAKTLATRSVHFWSRSRNRLWEKGETSGHKLHVKELFIDCDRDTILVKAQPEGPTCHT